MVPTPSPSPNKFEFPTLHNAYSQIYSQMVGAQGMTCSTHQNGSGDAAQPSLYICTFTEPNGTSGQCPALTQTVPGSMQSYIDITGAKTTITGGQVPVGIRPILVQAKP